MVKDSVTSLVTSICTFIITKLVTRRVLTLIFLELMNQERIHSSSVIFLARLRIVICIGMELVLWPVIHHFEKLLQDLNTSAISSVMMVNTFISTIHALLPVNFLINPDQSLVKNSVIILVLAHNTYSIMEAAFRLAFFLWFLTQILPHQSDIVTINVIQENTFIIMGPVQMIYAFILSR